MFPEIASLSRRRIASFALWVTVFAGGTLLLFLGIGEDSLWYDESYSMAVVEHSFSEIVTLMAGDVHPPLYLLMLKAWVSVFGATPFAARALSALGIIALAGLGIYPLRLWWSTSRALTYSVLCFITPMAILTGREIRMYSWLAFFVTAALLSAWMAWSTRRRRAILLMVLFTLAAAYTHIFGVMASGFLWAAFLAALVVRRHPLTRAAAIGAGLVLLAYLPWMSSLIGQASRVNANYWIEPVSWKGLLWVLSFPFGFKFTMPDLSVIAFVLTVHVIAYGCRRCLRDQDVAGMVVLAGIGIYLLTLAAAVVLSFLISPMLVPRYMMACLGLVLLAMAYGLHSLPHRAWGIVLTVGWLAATVPTLIDVYQHDRNGPMHLVHQKIQGDVQPGDVFLHNGEHNFGNFAYYFPDHEHYLHLPDPALAYGNYEVFDRHGRFGNDLNSLLQRSRVIWLTLATNDTRKFPREVLAKAGYQSRPGDPRFFDNGHPWYKVRVFRFERPAP